jgi:hypothetical protein
MSFQADFHVLVNVEADGSYNENKQRGVTSINHAGAGGYILTCDEKFAAADVVLLPAVAAGGDVTIGATMIGLGEIAVQTKIAGADADAPFALAVIEIPGVNS